MTRKVIFISAYPPIPSGVAEYAKYLVYSLSKKNVEIHVISFYMNNVPIIEHKGNIKIYRILSDNPLSILKLFSLIRKINPDVIHYNLHMTIWSKHRSLNFLYSIIPLLTKLLTRKKVIVTMHNLIEFVDKEPLRKYYSINFISKIFGYVATWFYSRVDEIIMLTRLYNNYMRRMYRANVRYIPHGFMRERDGHVIKKSGFKVGVFGFISPYKKYDIVLNAYNKLKKMLPEVSLKIVGGPHPDFPEIYNNLRNLVHDGIKLTGYVPSDRLDEYLHDVDVIILPYIGWAGVSGALHYAVSLNKPVIISDIPEMRWLVKELDLKTLFFDLNNVDDLVNKLLLLYYNPYLRSLIINHNKKIVENLYMENIADIYLKVYGMDLNEEKYEEILSS